MSKYREELLKITTEISRWAEWNFGLNESKFDTRVVLHGAGPAFGMVEEMGEALEALQSGDIPNLTDSLADFLIFSSDFFCRSFGPETAAAVLDSGLVALSHRGTLDISTVILLGKFCHINLKSHQGIRGYHERVRVLNELNDVWVKLLCSMTNMVSEGTKSAIDDVYVFNCLVSTWEIVKSRNWKTDAMSGAVAKPPL